MNCKYHCKNQGEAGREAQPCASLHASRLRRACPSGRCSYAQSTQTHPKAYLL